MFGRTVAAVVLPHAHATTISMEGKLRLVGRLVTEKVGLKNHLTGQLHITRIIM